MNMILKDLFSSQFPFIEDITIDIYLHKDMDIIEARSGRKEGRFLVLDAYVLANKKWNDREVQKYAEHDLDHFEYYQNSRKLYVYLKGDLEI